MSGVPTSSATRRLEPCRDERTRPLARRSGLTEAEGSLIPGTRGKVASSPDKAGAGQHCQMIWRPASETGRCNDSESVYESLSRANHQLQSDGYGLGCGAYSRGYVRGTRWSVYVAEQGGHGEGLRRSRGEAAGA